MTKTPQTIDELQKHLRDNVGFLEASCASFDSGFLGEAKRLATTIRVLLHDTNKSQSLLGLLGMKNSLKYINTANQHDPNNLFAHHGLLGMRFGSGGPSYWAPLGDGPPSRYNRQTCTFDEWWNENVIIDKRGGVFSRRNLVLSLANMDGGAHVDPLLDKAYSELTRSDSVGWMISDGTEARPLSDIELHSVRQIAYELMQSLNAYGYNNRTTTKS
ncbi:MAG: hypothetical protein Q7U10_08235 [Thermodesulfovibrionia bacterium]|nr:hypothetical protein [Thermodesulfovibrionia bacterium]